MTTTAYTTYKWSVEEYHALIAQGFLTEARVELLDGEIIEMSPESLPHSYTSQSVGDYLREVFQGIAQIREAHPITLDNSEPEPDIAVVRLPSNIYRNHHPYSEDIFWLIEISNRTLKKDLEDKAKTYARNAILEYWVIDLVNKKLVVFSNIKHDNYTQKQELTTGTISPQAFPQINLDLSKLLLLV
jgi:Uma2 family endonuclease